MFTFLCHTISITPAKNPDNDKVPQNEVLIFDLQKWTNFNLVQKSQSSKVIPTLQKIRENVMLSKSNCNFGFFLKDFGSIVHQQQPPLVSRSKSNSTMSGAKKSALAPRHLFRPLPYAIMSLWKFRRVTMGNHLHNSQGKPHFTMCGPFLQINSFLVGYLQRYRYRGMRGV